MIQIIGLRPYTDKDGKAKLRQRYFGERTDVPSVFTDVASIVQDIPDAERWNIYYTAADCKDRAKGLRKFQSQSVIPFDIDGLDTKRIDDYIPCVLSALRLDYQNTGIVFTGNGLQFILQLTDPFNDTGYFGERRIHYKAICDRVDQALASAELPGNCDPAVWDQARLLRLPGTENRKKPPKGITKSHMIQPNIAPQKFVWSELSGVPELTATDHLEFIPGKSPKLDDKAITKQCNFIKEVTHGTGDIREPQYYAAASIIGRMDDGRIRLHNVQSTIRTAGSDSSIVGYTPSQLDKKIDQALEASGPRTCKNINMIWGKCNNCPLFGKITSPISIKDEAFIATKESGFHSLSGQGKPIPAYNDLLKYFDENFHHKTINQNGLVYIYNGTHYELYSKFQIQAFAETNFRPKPKHSVRTEFEKKVQSTKLVPTDFFTESINGFINFQNGVLNIKSGTFGPNTPDKGFRYVLPYDYDPSATAPRFDRFLDEVTGDDKTLRALLEEFGGYCLSGDKYWLHKCLLLVGEGSNGKSKFQEALQMIAGNENVSNVDLKDLGDINSRQLLEGKLFNIAEELSHKDMIETKILKQLSSGARTQVKLMWNQPYSIENMAKLVFSCNTIPDSTDRSHGFLRRMIMVPFNQTFEGDNADPFLMEKFEAEKAGIFNILLDGYKRLHAQGRFTSSAAADQALAEYKVSNNPVELWLQETQDVKVNELNGRCHFASTDDLHARYEEWLIGKGKNERAWTMTTIEFARTFARSVPSGTDRRVRKRFGKILKRGFWDIEVEGAISNVERAEFDTHSPEQDIPF